MSNIIRSQPRMSNEKKVIQTKKIERNSLIEPITNPAQRKQQLLQEVEALEEQYRQLQDQIKLEQAEAERNIETWWKEKQQEAILEAEKRREDATTKGYQEGFNQGISEAEDQFRNQRNEMQDLLQTAYREKEKVIQQSESFLLSLSTKIAKKIIKAELKQDDSRLLNIVRQALKHMEESEDVVIKVSSEDYPILLPFLDELKTYVRADSELKLIPIANLEQGSCQIDTASGSYDVTIDSQLEEIKKHLLAYCEEKTNDEPKGR